MFKRYLCLGCGFLYDEALGLPEHGVTPRTRWADIPVDWVCPDCGTAKSALEVVALLKGEPSVAQRRARHTRLASTGLNASYVAGHPDGVIIRHSSFNFHDYQIRHRWILQNTGIW